MVGCVAFADAFHMTTETKKLTRSSSDRVIAGVAGGLGRYFNVDPVVARLVFIVLVFLGGAGFLVYGAAWLLVPAEGAEGEGFDAAGVARRLGILLGVLVLTGAAAALGFWGVASGGGVATAIVVIAAGALLVVGAFTGGVRWLIVPAFALALSAGAAAAANVDVRGGAGERIYRPASVETMRHEYRLGMGHLLVDLRGVDFGTGSRRLHVKLGVGQAEVLVPDNVCVSTTGHVAVGATTIFDHQTGGIDHDSQDLNRASAGTPQLNIDGDVGVGELRVQHFRVGTGPAGSACNA